MKRVFEPSENLYKYLTEEERLNWAEWLETTDIKQCNDFMSKGENTACCLHIWEIYNQNDGEWFDADDYQLPSDLDRCTKLTSGHVPKYIEIARYKMEGSQYYICGPAGLNDSFKLTFKEIAQILRGNSVTKEY